MNFEDITIKQKSIYNECVNHPLQTFEWGLFREKTGVGVIRRGVIQKNRVLNPYQLTLHKTPMAPFQIGYLPKGNTPSKELINELNVICKQRRVSFIQLEPNAEKFQISNFPGLDKRSGAGKFQIGRLRRSFHPLFTKYTFILDINKSEEELLKNMHQKTRYNIRLSEKKGVKVSIDNSDKAFNDYLQLTSKTSDRQKFYAHSEKYHKLMWETLGNNNNNKFDPLKLQAHLLKTTYKNKTLVTYVLFTFKDTLYYPYGASSDEHREVMASHAAMWNAILFGKRLGLSKFDMWGAANTPEPKEDDPYIGFHKFKKGFGADLVEFVGSYDLVNNNLNYQLLKYADKIRWIYLKTIK